MHDPTNSIRRLAAALFATVATLIAVPVAQGFDGSPDAIDRYRANNEVQVSSTLPLGGSPDAIDRYRDPKVLAFDGSPDAIDRFREGQTVVSAAPILGSPDAIDRYRANQALVTQPRIQGSPDAIDRFNATQALLSQPSTNGSPDAIDRYLGKTAVVATVPSTSDGFDWGDFGIGAASMFGLAMLLAGLGLGALAVRHRGGQLGTS
jgi:hypothetical protein